MGKMTIKCNSEQLKYIQKDFEDAEDGIVEGIVKYRMRNNEKKG